MRRKFLHFQFYCELSTLDSGLCEDGLKSENLLDVDLDTNFYFDAVTGSCYPFGVQVNSSFFHLLSSFLFITFP